MNAGTQDALEILRIADVETMKSRNFGRFPVTALTPQELWNVLNVAAAMERISMVDQVEAFETHLAERG